MRSIFFLLAILFSNGILAQSASQMVDKGIAFYGKGKLEDAIKSYSAAIEKDSTYVNAYICRGAAYKVQHKYKEALRDYGRAQHFKPDIPDIYYNRSNLFFEIRDHGHALIEINKAIDLEPYNSNFQVNKGVILFELNQSEDAIRMFQYAIMLDSTNARAYTTMCNCLVRDMRYDAALPECEKALKMSKVNEYANLMNIVNIYLKKQPLQKSIELLEDMAKRFPARKAETYNQLGYVYMKDKQYGKAMPYFQFLIREKKYGFEASYNLAFCNLKLEKYNEALLGFDGVIKENPDYAYAYVNRAFCFYQLNKFDKATEDCNKAIEIEPTGSYSYYLLGKINHLFNKDKDACDALTKAQNLGCKEPDLSKMMAESCR